MRRVEVLKKADFTQQGKTQQVTLPHTWNAADGQDGGNDYYRGKCRYEIELPDPVPGKRQFIQFEGANHTAVVFCNGKEVGEHRGGFSTFRLELTEYLKEQQNRLTVEVDNDSPEVYPQQADFTFFGGLYRNVSLIEVEQEHISLTLDGTDGVFVTPQADGTTRVDVFVVNAAGCCVEVKLRERDSQQEIACEVKQVEEEETAQVTFILQTEDIHKWKGTQDPFLYEAAVTLKKGDMPCDSVVTAFGYRDFAVDSEKGFFLNGEEYPLHGVSRHQDRENMGWAITDKEQKEDMQILKEIGANAVRLAHYQHSRIFYDLCDENGMIVWAEIPFISKFLPSAEAKENSLQQLRELIAQNYNHPSICFWGISNEITIGGESEALNTNLAELAALAKRMDPSRRTTMAQLATVDPQSRQCTFTDVLGYNIYCGWYTGQAQDNGEVLDELHRKLPGRPLALSEYGADALPCWHSARSRNHDYTEEYQAYYHEELLKTFETRPWLWGTFVWNLFDFAADARDEGGCKGRNNKGLVTYDRKIRKDAFYIYQAYWSEEPMVYLCGRRFVNRGPKERDIKVYTNCSQVTLYLNGKKIQTLTAEHHKCIFQNLPLTEGENELEVRTETEVEDHMTLNAVQEPDQSYLVPEDQMLAGNWFDEETGETLRMEFPEGYYSIKDTLGEIMKNPQAAAVFLKLKETFGKKGEQRTTNQQQSGGQDQAQMMKSLAGISLQQLMKLGGMDAEPGILFRVNHELNQIKK